MNILYSTGCPKCNKLKKKLESKNVSFTENSDVDIMLSKGFQEVPMLEINGVIMDFKAANKWLDEIGE